MCREPPPSGRFGDGCPKCNSENPLIALREVLDTNDVPAPKVTRYGCRPAHVMSAFRGKPNIQLRAVTSAEWQTVR
jgi:hypothetical protein